MESGPSQAAEAVCMHGAIKYGDIIAKEESFVDFEWGPNVTSIYDQNDDLGDVNTKFYDTIEWRSASEIWASSSYDIFPEGIEADRIKQGRLGDCYFVTCLASLASTPERLRKLFITPTANKAGCYAI